MQTSSLTLSHSVTLTLMATENKVNPNPNTTKNKKRKQRYLPHNVLSLSKSLYSFFFFFKFLSICNFIFLWCYCFPQKPVKKKGGYPLHPGVQGFFITCDGGRERQASREALNVIDSVRPSFSFLFALFGSEKMLSFYIFHIWCVWTLREWG